VAGSRLPALSGRGRRDSGRARSYRWLKSDDQSGLVTLEWIILIAAVSGIVTLALLAGWNALWNRSDSLSDEGGSGHQLAANRAAAEASSGRACSLLNDLYTYEFKYVPVAGSTDCTCEIDSEATASQVCDVKAEVVTPTLALERGGAYREIDVSQLFFSENSASLVYSIGAPLPDTTLLTAAFEPAPNGNILKLTPVIPGVVGATHVTVQARDSNTSSSANIRMRVDVEGCVPDSGNNLRLPYSAGLITSTPSAGNVTSYHLDPYFPSPAESFVIDVSNSEVLSHSTFRAKDQTILNIVPLRSGLARLEVTSTSCLGNTQAEDIYFSVNSSNLMQVAFTPQTYSSSPQTIDLSSYFNEANFHGGVDSYRAVSEDVSVATVSVTGSNLTITKVANGTVTILVYVESNSADMFRRLNVTFS